VTGGGRVAVLERVEEPAVEDEVSVRERDGR
jgi:hypothetical protein